MATSITTDPLVEDIEDFSTEQLISYLQTKNLNLNNTDYKKIHDERVAGLDFLQLTRDILCSEPYKFPNGPARRVEMLVKSLNDQKLLDPEIYASSVPPVINYPDDASTTINSINSGGLWPSKITRWNGFLDEAIRFNLNQSNICKISKLNKPQFIDGLKVRVEPNIETAIAINIFHVLNQFLGPEFEFSKQKSSDFNHDDPNIGIGLPDFTCQKYNDSNDSKGQRIIEIEVKKDIVVKQLYEINLDVLFSYKDGYLTGCANGDLTNVIKQLYNYMIADELQYGILASYDHHWFFYRPSSNPSTLLISDVLSLQSTSPPVIKTYAYLVYLANIDYKSPYPLIIKSRIRQGQNQNSGSNNQSSSYYNQQGSGDSSGLGISYHNQQDSGDDSGSGISYHNQKGFSNQIGQNYTTEIQERTYSYKEIKLEGILGSGQTGRTFKAIICEEPVAMKAIDLFKKTDFLHKIKKEINIYQILMEIQERYIPKLVCYGYYGYGMGYFMGIIMVGTNLYHHMIDCNQKNRALEALRAIHSYGILHNDIRQENILVNEKGEIYIIDFEMSIITNDKRQFYNEKSELSNLLDHYMFQNHVMQ